MPAHAAGGRSVEIRGPAAAMRRLVLFLALAVTVAPLILAASPAPTPADGSSPAPSPSIANVGPSTAPAASVAAVGVRPLVFAYYYIWYTETSWRRAKIDLPQLGRYDSRDRGVVAQQMRWVREAGIDGLIVSWKHEPRLDAALSVVIDEATKAGVKLILLYQGLDFDRLPLDPATVSGDLTWFLDRYGDAEAFRIFGRPLIVWSGTWGYKNSEIEGVRTAIGAPDKALLLGSERSAEAYQGRATLFDGDAYYWSSPDPLMTPRYQRRLDDLAQTVRADGGRWIAPAAPGFDARLIGGTSIVDRRGGETLRAAWSGALQTDPDVLGVISWNEYSENSYIEPSTTFGDKYLQLTHELIAAMPAAGAPGEPSPSSGGGPASAAPLPSIASDIPPSPSSTTAAGSAISNLWSIVAGIALVGGLFAIGRRLRRVTP
jgi:hypothetical protein